MSNPSTSIAAELFRQAAAQGRGKLDAAEVTSLLGSLGLAIDAQAAAGAVDIRISLNNTREFGMVLSAGLGGLEAELDEGGNGRLWWGPCPGGGRPDEPERRLLITPCRQRAHHRKSTRSRPHPP